MSEHTVLASFDTPQAADAAVKQPEQEDDNQYDNQGKYWRHRLSLFYFFQLLDQLGDGLRFFEQARHPGNLCGFAKQGKQRLRHPQQLAAEKGERPSGIKQNQGRETQPIAA